MRIRFDAREWLGAFGDIGVLVPILLGLAVVNGVDLQKTLALAGAAYIGAALLFRLPVPVQPLKAMAAIALAQGLGTDVIRAASVWMGVVFLLLSWRGGARSLGRMFPRPVVNGLQLGVGLLLIKAAWKLAFTAPRAGVPWLSPAGALEPADFVQAFFVLFLPQIPLTLGNSVYGTSDALSVYYPGKAGGATPGRLCASLGWINAAAGLVGAYPLCHGSGGVTAHARLGARTAGATIIMGTVCLLLALAAGPQAYDFLARIPKPALAALLLFVGLCHSKLFLALGDNREKAIAFLMGIVTLATGHLGWALCAGITAHFMEEWLAWKESNPAKITPVPSAEGLWTAPTARGSTPAGAASSRG